MATQSKIEWTERTWNPTTGCNKVSPGCEHCYAKTMAKRLEAMEASGYQNGFDLTLQPHRLNQPLKRKKPTVYFVNSMSDLFHKAIPDQYLDQVFDVIRKTPQHTYQILTKRAERLPGYFTNRDCPPNVWLGVTVENKADGIPRIDHLRKIEASVRFVSVEPLLEDLGPVDFTGIHWVIVGGESGPKARPMKAEWAETVRRYAKSAGAAYFFKQWGTWGADGVKRAKQLNGRELNGTIYDEYPAAFTNLY
jgi:protein gp37